MFFKFQEIMKKILTLFIAFFSLTLVHSQEKKPEISFEKTVIDYGTVNKGDNVVKTKRATIRTTPKTDFVNNW